jgi:hypothetical protein
VQSEYIGLGEQAGWRFTLEPQEQNGSPGYMLRQLAPATANVELLDGAGHAWNCKHSPEFAAGVERRVLNPDPSWRETEWLTQWLKCRMIREVAA